ncbi:transcriptional regulator with XRE-family HTH domain [Aquimarina sp. EL_43]|uniref:helix-turn-helix domain-containing protein n=2 Tax=Aquimarina TaxID=290174 RepID=UPI0018CBCC34|nr:MULTISPECIES: helix-turn-helix transcriptional regulator [unclassified Aquimarina]MBG6132761.1 transcriptional regulator with XRE-family HTH domain [Aquimarina sp. EL_35]MBG6153162.1 transcriptional regulator with XRE-family HTH domain [Aquimarina sp. EL_32]MBG6171318.1 transcriptional regulator with XRE-family HTH domain [Aquimarina sp. EL_43]
MKINQIMKQPELGQKISELRKSKGLTQEELVEQCNISVRTIQRIEAGDVTPRSYTIKTILSALDYDLERIQTEESRVAKEFKKLFLLDIDDSKEVGFLIKQLSIAWISGIVYFILGFAEIVVDYYRYTEDLMVTNNFVYIVLKIGMLASVILFTRGFILTGKIFKNYLLRITAFIFIFIGVLFYIYDILSLYIVDFDYQFVLGAEAVTYGVIGILFGISILRLQNGLGTLATVTGIFEIITYGFMVTIILSLIGLVLLTPTIILEIILLYKVSQMLKAKQKEIAPD